MVPSENTKASHRLLGGEKKGERGKQRGPQKLDPKTGRKPCCRVWNFS